MLLHFWTSPKKSNTPSHQVQPDFLTGLGTKVQVATLVTLSMDPRRLRLRVGTWAVAMTLVGSADRTCLSSILGLQHSTKHGLFQTKMGSFGFQVYECSTYASLNIYLNRCAFNWTISIYKYIQHKLLYAGKTYCSIALSMWGVNMMEFE